MHDGQQALDLVAEILVVARLAWFRITKLIFNPGVAPIGVRLQEFLHDAQALFRGDVHQQERESPEIP